MTINEDRRWRGEIPLPVPHGMVTMTRRQVADLFGVDQRVVTRYAARGVLTKYRTPGKGVGRSGTVVFNRTEVLHVQALRRSTAKHGSDPAPGSSSRQPSTSSPAARPRRW